MIKNKFNVCNEFVILELPKLGESELTDLRGIELWGYYSKNANRMTDQQLEIIDRMNPTVTTAVDMLKRVSFADEEYRDYLTTEDLMKHLSKMNRAEIKIMVQPIIRKNNRLIARKHTYIIKFFSHDRTEPSPSTLYELYSVILYYTE